MKFIFHIGYHKTGSTAIQQAVADARPALLKIGIFVPISASSWHGAPDLAWACFSSRLLWADIEPSDPKHLLQSWAAAAVEADCDTVLVSSEELSRLDLEPAAFRTFSKAVQPYDVSIVGYTRAPLSFLLSRYRHEVQNGDEIRSVSDFFRSPAELLSADFATRAIVWRGAFGDRVKTFDYHESKRAGNITPHFFQHIGAPDLVSALSTESKQEIRLHPALIDMRRYITAIVEDENKSALSDAILKFSDLLTNLCPKELSLNELINSTVSSRDGHDLFPSALPVVRSIECSDAPHADKTAAITEFWSLRDKVREAPRGPQLYAAHLLWPPQSDESELLDLLAARFGHS
jgi:hypothetical protein